MRKRLIPLIIGILSMGLAFLAVISFEGWWKFLFAVPMLAFGWPSIKTALFAPDKEIAELTGELPMTDETVDKLKDRV
jgi:hypothetical protein